ncbi:MAG TPA: hypothetical protein VMZ31_12110 [Phycisphaerae bacterium]|nr:hypothetical protein [Phycisphaerae bacterium]
MSEERQELVRINWSECFPFTQLFRSFRLSVHPPKLLLALLAVLAIYGAGRLMDGIWGRRVVVDAAATETAPGGEVEAFLSWPRDAFSQWRRDAEERRVVADASLAMQTLEDLRSDRDKARGLAEEGGVCGRIEEELDRKLDDAVEALDQRLKDTQQILTKQVDQLTGQASERAESELPARKRQVKQAHDALLVMLTKGGGSVPPHLTTSGAMDRLLILNSNLTDAKDREEDAKSLEKDRATLRDALALRAALDQGVSRRGRHIFDTMMKEGITTVGLAMRSVLAGKFWTDDRPDELPGLVGSVKRGVMVCVWFFYAHWLFAVIYTAIWLVVWAVAGGAICRLAALHATRDEKISLREAVKFSLTKFVSFLTAPLIPLILIAVIGAITFVGGFVGAIPAAGQLLAGVLWSLALLAGFVMALVAIGAAAGTHLMYPTIATEGSDAFDAISRSFSYIYSRPWRLGWYLLVSIVYGTICLLFMKFLAFLLLRLAHAAAGLGMNVDGASKLATYGKLDAIWGAPVWGVSLFGRFGHVPLGGAEQVAAVLIAIFVFLVVGTVVAFVASFFFSASTVMYLLLRREVDATDLEDVYVEEEEEPFEPPAAPQADEAAAAEGAGEPEQPSEPESSGPETAEPKQDET